MMDTTINRRTVLSATGVVLLSGSAATSPTGASEHTPIDEDDYDGADRSLEQELESFTAVLTDEAYEGEIETEPLGEAIFELHDEDRNGEDELWYDVFVRRLRDPREATLHLENGCEIEQLCPAETEGSLQFEGLYSGLLCADVLTDDDLDGLSLDELVEEMRDEEISVTIRTEERPEGALRGRTGVSEEVGIAEEGNFLEEDLEDAE